MLLKYGDTLEIFRIIKTSNSRILFLFFPSWSWRQKIEIHSEPWLADGNRTAKQHHQLATTWSIYYSPSHLLALCTELIMQWCIRCDSVSDFGPWKSSFFPIIRKFAFIWRQTEGVRHESVAMTWIQRWHTSIAYIDGDLILYVKCFCFVFFWIGLGLISHALQLK